MEEWTRKQKLPWWLKGCLGLGLLVGEVPKEPSSRSQLESDVIPDLWEVWGFWVFLETGRRGVHRA